MIEFCTTVVYSTGRMVRYILVWHAAKRRADKAPPRLVRGIRRSLTVLLNFATFPIKNRLHLRGFDGGNSSLEIARERLK